MTGNYNAILLGRLAG